MTTSDFTNIGAIAANIIFSVVVAWYLLTKAIPALQEKFSADLRQQAVDYKLTLESEQKATERVISMVVSSNTDGIRRSEEKLDRILLVLDDIRIQRRSQP